MAETKANQESHQNKRGGLAMREFGHEIVQPQLENQPVKGSLGLRMNSQALQDFADHVSDWPKDLGKIG